jgi:hypothetical protein
VGRWPTLAGCPRFAPRFSALTCASRIQPAGRHNRSPGWSDTGVPDKRRICACWGGSAGSATRGKSDNRSIPFCRRLAAAGEAPTKEPPRVYLCYCALGYFSFPALLISLAPQPRLRYTSNRGEGVVSLASVRAQSADPKWLFETSACPTAPVGAVHTCM